MWCNRQHGGDQNRWWSSSLPCSLFFKPGWANGKVAGPRNQSFESSNLSPGIMKIKIDIARCKGCSLCVSECPCKNIRMSDDLNKSGTNYAEIISQEDCTGCALCFKMCPDLAIEINSRG